MTTYGRDYVSARWTGRVRPAATEAWTLFLTATEGARLFFNHTLVIDAWAGAPAGGTSDTHVPAGAPVAPRMSPEPVEETER